MLGRRPDRAAAIGTRGRAGVATCTRRSRAARGECARQRLARTGKNLARLGSRRSGPGRNRNAARRHGGAIGVRRRHVRRHSGGRSGADRGAGAGAAPREPRGLPVAEPPLRGSCLGAEGVVRWLRQRTGSAGMFHRRFRFRRCGARRSVRFLRQPALDLHRYRFIDRAGVGFLLGDAQLREHVEDHVRFHLELAGQLVDTDFLILCAPPSNCDTGVVRFNPAPYPEPPRLPGTPQFLS